MRQQQRRKKRFQFIRTLGQGTCSKVKMALDRETGKEVAIKTIKKDQVTNLYHVYREIDIMHRLKHPYIISIYEVFESANTIAIVMEHAEGGELYDWVNQQKGLCEADARRVFRQLLSAVHHMHENGIVHRDLKLENILLDKERNVKVADFGLSNYYSFDETLSTYCGSLLYASPEIVSGQPYCGPEIECWSLGVLLYSLVYGNLPFTGSDYNKIRHQITQGEFSEPEQKADASGLIKQLLTVKASNRATLEDAEYHWWVNLGYRQAPHEELEIRLSTEDLAHEKLSNAIPLSVFEDSKGKDNVHLLPDYWCSGERLRNCDEQSQGCNINSSSPELRTTEAHDHKKQTKAEKVVLRNKEHIVSKKDRSFKAKSCGYEFERAKQPQKGILKKYGHDNCKEHQNLDPCNKFVANERMHYLGLASDSNVSLQAHTLEVFKGSGVVKEKILALEDDMSQERSVNDSPHKNIGKSDTLVEEEADLPRKGILKSNAGDSANTKRQDQSNLDDEVSCTTDISSSHQKTAQFSPLQALREAGLLFRNVDLSLQASRKCGIVM